MDHRRLPRSAAAVWELAQAQHGVVARSQLLDLGFGPDSIKHRISKGRLHPLWRGVYAVGRPEVGQRGRWMGAVLSCGPEALLSHRSAAALWGIGSTTSVIEVVVPRRVARRRPGIRVHRSSGLGPEHRRHVDGIPVTDLVSTLVDLASCVIDGPLEKAINEADRLDLIDPEELRAAVEPLRRRLGLPRLRRLLGCEALTDTGLERRFLAVVRSAGLSEPETQAMVNGYRVDFYWRGIGLVVEADGWRYHRTPGEQATDRRRDQTHAKAGLTTLRFGEAQIRDRPDEVRKTLVAVAGRLSRSGEGSGVP
jgi:very-short-patch-repair endonuclease